MRQIGTIEDERLAQRFGDYLTTIRIDHSIDESQNGFAIWVHDDDDLDRARAELAEFEQTPNDPKYNGLARTAQKARKQEERAQDRRAKNFVDVRTNWAGIARHPRPLTIAMILACVVVGIATRLSPFDPHTPLWEWLSFASPRAMHAVFNPRLAFIYDLEHGQVWRLVTPVFMHIGFIHLLFNMLWLADLGMMIELRKGTLKFALIALASAVIPCVVQNFWHGPTFAGMSGVVYGLFGYCWMKGRLQPQDQIGVSDSTVIIMILWLVACMTGYLGAVANAAHVAGLVVGVVIGAMPTWWRKVKRGMR
jgi:GlpG protein